MDTFSRRGFLGTGTAALSLLAPGMSPAHAGHVPWARLDRRLRGRLVRPSDPVYRTARQLDLAQFDAVAPKAVAYCESPHDVALCLAFVQDHDVPFAARSGGHSYGGYSTSPGLVIDVSRLGSVTAGPRSVRVGAGAQAVDVLNALAPYGLALPCGTWATIAAAGFVQGGGIGYLTRALGLACDRVTAAQVVLADGRAVTASPEEHPGLYWALRGGGGGNFGVVTSYSMTPAAVGPVRTARLSWAWDHAVGMMDGFAHWLVDAPRTIGGAAVAVLVDAAPGGTPLAGVTLLSTGSDAEFTAEVARLVSLCGPPADRSVDRVPYRSFMMEAFKCGTLTASQCHRTGSTPEGRLPRAAYGLVRGRMFGRPLPRAAWERALEVFDLARVPGQTHKLEVLALGGAAGDPGRTDTAYVHRDTLFDINYLSVIGRGPAGTAAKIAAKQWADAGFHAVDPHSNGETYQNFIDPSLRDWRRAYYAENYARLSSVKAEYDPYGAFRFPQGIDPAPARAEGR
ncbi:FAD-binding oxidoreductase [Streptomyces roseifaciens]